jgi:DNA-binding response OmpR family regulator
MRILVIDDEQSIREFLKVTLESESFTVDTAADGEHGSYIARTNEYDLIILDNMLPKKTGLEICKELRLMGNTTPILMLSVQSEIADKTTLLDSGADDYLTKPYSHQELLARVRALLRRQKLIKPTILALDGMTLNTDSQELIRNKKNIYLTRKEFALLELLVQNKDKVVSRGMIMEHVWHMDDNPMSKTIETHILNLRKKIEQKNKRLIQNIPGRGYKIAS